MPSFDAVVSLGAWCQVAFQVKKHEWPLQESCFDWLVTPWDSLLKVLETDGELLGKDVFYEPAAISFKCSHYGLLYYHEFPQDNDGKPYLAEDALSNVRSKLIYKYRKMVDRLQSGDVKRVLFIRYGGAAVPAYALPYHSHDLENQRDGGDLNSLLALLQKKFPRIEPSLLFLEQPPHTIFDRGGAPLDPRVHVATMPVPIDEQWEGEDDVWSRVLDECLQMPDRPRSRASAFLRRLLPRRTFSSL
jgi:hypothetical protein